VVGHCTTFKASYPCRDCAKTVRNARTGIKYAKKEGRPDGVEACALRGHIAFVRSVCTNPEIHGWKEESCR